MASTISVVYLRRHEAAMTEVQTLSALPKDFSGNNTAAEIAMHPSGNFSTARIAGMTASPCSP